MIGSASKFIPGIYLSYWSVQRRTFCCSFLKNSLRKMSQTSCRGVDLKKITTFLENFAPKSLAEAWDNTGLLVEPTVPRFVENVLLTNDLTEDVIHEALELDIGLIISYHPPIFKPLNKITTKSWKERIIATCLENKIAIYSPHTSWDCVAGGVNDWLASAFDFELIQPINEIKSETSSNLGAGRYCKLKQGIKISDAVAKVKQLTSTDHLKLALAKGATLDTTVTEVAICAGSGATVLRNSTAELYLTGEMSHHDLLDAIHNGTSVILCNHSNSERGFLTEFKVKMNSEFGPDIKVFVSKRDKDPMQVI